MVTSVGESSEFADADLLTCVRIFSSDQYSDDRKVQTVHSLYIEVVI